MDNVIDHADVGRFARLRGEILTILEFVGLNALVVAWPIFAALRRDSVAVLMPRNPSVLELWLLVVTILLLPPLVAWGLELIMAATWPDGRPEIHATLLSVYVAVFAFAWFGNQASLNPLVLAIAAVPVGVAAYAIITSTMLAHTFLRWLSGAALLCALMFVASAAIEPIAFGSLTKPAAAVSIDNPMRVVVIAMDELPTASLLDGQGRIDAGLYPNFAGLARAGRWYRNATAVAPFAQAAIPALLTGRYPHDPQQAPLATNYPQNLFTLLGGTYTLNVHEASAEYMCPTNLCPRSSGSLLDLVGDASKAWKDAAEPKRSEPSDAVMKDQVPLADEFVRSLVRAARPRLDYLHVSLPEAPWHLLSTGQSYDDETGYAADLDPEGQTWADEPAPRLGRQRHMLQLQAVDRLVGQIVVKLQLLDEYRDATIVVTGTQGASFRSGEPFRVATSENYADVMWSPLIVKGPGMKPGSIDDRFARAIDVLPTIAALVEVEIPWAVDGRSLLSDPGPNEVQFLAWPSRVADNPPREAVYETYDGPAGSDTVLATPAANPNGRTPLRLYGVGKYAAIVGRDPEPMIDVDAKGPLGLIVSIRNCVLVRPASSLVRCADLEAGLSGGPQVFVAVAVNGKIGAVTPTAPNLFGRPRVRTLLPTELMRRGAQALSLFVVTGDPERPRLVPIKTS